MLKSVKEKLVYISTDGVRYMTDNTCDRINRKASEGFRVFICETVDGLFKNYVIFDRAGNPILLSKAANQVKMFMDAIKIADI